MHGTVNIKLISHDQNVPGKNFLFDFSLFWIMVVRVCDKIYIFVYYYWRWRSWLRHCATSRQVAGSIPDSH